MFNCLCINDLFALQRYKNFWTFLLFPLCFKALSTIYLQVGNFSFDITYTNPKTGKSNTLRLEFYQDSPYYAAYRIKIDGMVWMDLSSKMDRTIDASIRNYGLNTK